nr:unnamed protein product [Digitaria exilis]
MKGPTKGGTKKSQGPSTKVGPKKTQDPPLHPYEQQRLSRCIQNSARLQQLGIPTIRTIFEDAAAISRDKNKKKHGNREDSGSEYDPVQDDTSEDDCIEDGSEKVCLHDEGSLIMCLCFLEDGDDDIARSDGHNHLSSEEGGGNNIGRSDGHNHLSSEAVGDVGYNDDNTMFDGPDAITLPAGDNQMINEESVEAELEVQRMANADLQSKMDDMSKKMQETEDARRRDQEELKEMKKKQAELEAALQRILTQN